MPLLESILPALNPGATGDETEIRTPPMPASETFDQVMANKFSPPGPDETARPASPLAGLKPDAAVSSAGDEEKFSTGKKPGTNPDSRKKGELKTTPEAIVPDAAQLLAIPVVTPVVQDAKQILVDAGAVPGTADSCLPAILKTTPVTNEVGTGEKSQNESAATPEAAKDINLSEILKPAKPVEIKLEMPTKPASEIPPEDGPTAIITPSGKLESKPSAGETTKSAPQNAPAISSSSAIDRPALVTASPVTEIAESLAPSEASGTAVAQQVMPMKNTVQTDKVAGQAEKVLPGNGDVAPARKTTSSGTGFKPDVSHHLNLETSATSTAGAHAPSDSAIDSAEPAISASAVKAQAATVEHTHNLVALNAIRLHESGATSLRVVIKPDAGTQLSLELRQRDTGVEAKALLQSGDFAHLNQHWPELQQRLEQRGVRLGALTSEQNFTATGGGQEQSQSFARQSGGEDILERNHVHRETTMNLAKPSRASEPVVPRPADHGWETWA